MKRRDLESRLRQAGCYLKRKGSSEGRSNINWSIIERARQGSFA